MTALHNLETAALPAFVVYIRKPESMYNVCIYNGNDDHVLNPTAYSPVPTLQCQFLVDIAYR